MPYVRGTEIPYLWEAPLKNSQIRLNLPPIELDQSFGYTISRVYAEPLEVVWQTINRGVG